MLPFSVVYIVSFMFLFQVLAPETDIPHSHRYGQIVDQDDSLSDEMVIIRENTRKRREEYNMRLVRFFMMNTKETFFFLL